MLHSTGNIKYLPRSRDMLGPGDAQLRKRGLAPGSPPQLHKHGRSNGLRAIMSKSAEQEGPAHSGCKGRPTQVLSSDSSLLADSSSSEDINGPSGTCSQWSPPYPKLTSLLHSESFLVLSPLLGRTLPSSPSKGPAVLLLSLPPVFLFLSEAHHHSSIYVPMSGSCIQTPYGAI